MGMSKRHKRSFVVLALGLSALAMDRLVLLPGPATAAAEASTFAAAPAVDLKAVGLLADQLLAASAPVQHPLMDGAAVHVHDAFSSRVTAPLQADAVAEPVEQARVEPRRAPSTPSLSAIVLTESGGYAVLNGRPLSLGATRDGYTLTALSSRSATIEMDGVRVTLSLGGDRQNVHISP
ncbi:MAG: hypothetical protein Kow0022_04340 [Phycisphaerales bacterium]